MKIKYISPLFAFSLIAACSSFPLEHQETSPQTNPATTSWQNQDSTLAALVKETLVNSNQFDSVSIEVAARQGKVLLSGYVKTIRQSDVAFDLASRVKGVQSVENLLVVRK